METRRKQIRNLNHRALTNDRGHRLLYEWTVVKTCTTHEKEKQRSFLFVHAIPLNTLLNKLQRERAAY